MNDLKISWLVVIGAMLSLFAWGYMSLDSRKLDRGIFEVHSQNVDRSMMQIAQDIRAMRELLDKRVYK